MNVHEYLWVRACKCVCMCVDEHRVTVAGGHDLVCGWEPCKGWGAAGFAALALLPHWAPFGRPCKGLTPHHFLSLALNNCAYVFMRAEVVTNGTEQFKRKAAAAERGPFDRDIAFCTCHLGQRSGD